MISILNQLIIIFLMIGAGFIARKTNIIDTSAQKSLSDIVLWILLPCAILDSANVKMTAGSLTNILYVILSAVIYYILAILFMIYITKLLKLPKQRRNLAVNLVVFANIAFIGYPMVTIFLGNTGILYASFFNMIYNIFFFTYGVTLITGRKVFDVKALLVGDLSIDSTIVMLILFVFQIQLPFFVKEFLGIMGNMCTPVSMLVIGSMLANVKFSSIVGEKSFYALSAIRLIGIPAIAVMLLKLLNVNKEVAITVLIMTAMPAGSLTAVFAEKYNSDIDYVSGGIFHTMICFLITMPLIAFVINSLF